MKTGLSKSRILSHRQCPKRLWLQVYRPELAQEEADTTARFNTGNQVGEIARTLYPDGVLIDSPTLGQALADTRQVLSETPRPVFEATFDADKVLVRADVLLPVADGYDLIEVKSSTVVKEYHYADVAVQAWVTRNAGVPIKRIKVAHIDNRFVYPGQENYQGLLAHVDVTDTVRQLENEVPTWIDSARQTLAGDQPAITPGKQCSEPYDCPFFAHCSPQSQSEFPVNILPRSGALATQLRAEGYEDLRDVPEEKLSSEIHQRIWRVSKSRQPELDSAVADELATLGYPRYYIDFETIHLAVPQWAGTRPYQKVPFQWSCHVEEESGDIRHYEFLAGGSSDPRRAFAESLIQTLGTSGVILVYNAAFECGRMEELAQDFSDLSMPLLAATQRLYDLWPLTRKHYYHPQMMGSWSLKVVLPAIAPELSYEGLEVADGGMAEDAFSEMMHPETTPERHAQLDRALRIYCGRDTLAMVKIVHLFEGRRHGGVD